LILYETFFANGVEPRYFVWPVMLFLAWVLGEYGALLRVPKIVTYGIVGLFCGPLVTQHNASFLAALLLLADAALGLVLTELGFRFNTRWFYHQPRVLLISLAEAFGCFFVVYLFCSFGIGLQSGGAATIASLSMATSPAAILLVARQEQSSGPLTNMVINLSAANCILSVLTYHVVTGFILRGSGAENSNYYAGMNFATMAVSVLVGSAVAILVKWGLYPLKLTGEARAFAIAISSISVSMFLHELRFSPIVGALAVGITMRSIGLKMTGIHQDFGSLGRLLTLFLFLFLSTQLQWDSIWEGFGVGFAILALRSIMKWGVLRTLGPACQLTPTQAWYTGLAMMPASSFTACLLEQSRTMGMDLLKGFNPIISFIFIAEIFGPIATAVGVIFAKESFEDSQS
jgi:Kef-type K+ transport system membrane component KefB